MPTLGSRIRPEVLALLLLAGCARHASTVTPIPSHPRLAVAVDTATPSSIEFTTSQPGFVSVWEYRPNLSFALLFADAPDATARPAGPVRLALDPAHRRSGRAPARPAKGPRPQNRVCDIRSSTIEIDGNGIARHGQNECLVYERPASASGALPAADYAPLRLLLLTSGPQTPAQIEATLQRWYSFAPKPPDGDLDADARLAWRLAYRLFAAPGARWGFAWINPSPVAP